MGGIQTWPWTFNLLRERERLREREKEQKVSLFSNKIANKNLCLRNQYKPVNLENKLVVAGSTDGQHCYTLGFAMMTRSFFAAGLGGGE